MISRATENKQITMKTPLDKNELLNWAKAGRQPKLIGEAKTVSDHLEVIRLARKNKISWNDIRAKLGLEMSATTLRNQTVGRRKKTNPVPQTP